ncbi:MAG: AsmA family protein [Pseudomonadaceae bacterium]|nr:AsmA family protein [Pseudomonadaceae bacterium]
MKTFAWIVVVLLLLIGGAVAYVAFNSGSLVKSGIERFGPQFLGVEVEVDDVELAITEGSAAVNGFRLGNPEGFAGADMMQVDQVKVVLDTSQISDTLVVMKEVVIDGADITAIAKGQRTNFQQLLANLDAANGSDAQATTETSDSAPGPKFIIDKFSFTNTRAALDSDVVGQLALAIPDIRLQDIGRKSNGVTGVELAQQILKPLTASITNEAVKQGLDIDGVKQNIEQRVRDKIGSGLKSLTDSLSK